MISNVSAVILAAGSGHRMQLNTTKQKIKIAGKTVLARTVETFNSMDLISNIVVVAKSDEIEFVKKELLGYEKVSKIVIGGSTRAESAKNGFLAIYDDGSEFVAIHDAARCFVTEEMILKVASDAIKYGAATASSLMTDTIKDVDSEGFIIKHRDRSGIRTMQTPQIFKKDLYLKALSSVDVLNPTITDDNILLEQIGVPVFCSDTGKANIKITVREDLEYAEYLAGEWKIKNV